MGQSANTDIYYVPAVGVVVIPIVEFVVPLELGTVRTVEFQVTPTDVVVVLPLSLWW